MKRFTCFALVATLMLFGCSSDPDANGTDPKTDTGTKTDTGNGQVDSDVGDTQDTNTPDPEDAGETADAAETTDDVELADTSEETDADEQPTCPDPYEDNDTVADATPVSSGDTIQAAICGIDDLDIFKIDLTVGQQITLTHQFVNANGNLDLNLHAPSQVDDVSKTGSAVAYTFAFDDEEILTHTAAEDGTYHVLVFNNEETENPYTLKFEVTGP